MKDMNLAKLAKDDVPLFLGILNDLFPEVDTPQIDYSEFVQEVEAELKDRKLQVNVLQTHFNFFYYFRLRNI